MATGTPRTDTQGPGRTALRSLAARLLRPFATRYAASREHEAAGLRDEVAGLEQRLEGLQRSIELLRDRISGGEQ